MREMDEAYIWAASQSGLNQEVVDEVSPWTEAENVDLKDEILKLIRKIDVLSEKVEDMETQ